MTAHTELPMVSMGVEIDGREQQVDMAWMNPDEPWRSCAIRVHMPDGSHEDDEWLADAVGLRNYHRLTDWALDIARVLDTKIPGIDLAMAERIHWNGTVINAIVAVGLVYKCENLLVHHDADSNVIYIA